MKKAFIVYFEDKSAVVVIENNMHNALACLSLEQMQTVSRIDLIPYEVL